MYGNYNYRFHGAIIGPSLSGKTSLLGHYAFQYLEELIVSQLWKKVFVFTLDAETILSHLQDLRELYFFMVDLTLFFLSQQKPIMKIDLQNIRKHLRSVPEPRTPNKALHPYNKIDILAKEINRIWNDPDGIELFVTHCFYLPISLSSALGIKKVAFFIDNIDSLDVILEEDSHFEVKKAVILIENIKYALSQSDFIVACKNSHLFYDSFQSCDQDGINLLDGLDYIPLTDFLPHKDIGSRQNYVFSINMVNNPQPFIISIELCGGIPKFFDAWDDLNKSIVQLEKSSSKTDQEELAISTIYYAQILVNLLLEAQNDHNESQALTVDSVKKVIKDSNFKTL